MKKHILTTLIILSSITLLFSQNSRPVAVLDMSNYNTGTSVSRKIAVKRMMSTIGIPHIVTTDLTTALQYPVVVTSTRVESGALSSSEVNQIIDYVNNGGVLITSSMRESALFSLCGISDSKSTNTLYSIVLDTANAAIYNYVNEPYEVVLSIGDTSKSNSFYTRYYPVTTGTVLASYADGSAALVKNGVTSGGSVHGELEVSKNLLENDHMVSIRSFRAGHLAFNDSLIYGMEMLNYAYNSTYPANDILSSFPFYALKTRSFSSYASSVIEIPLTISDVVDDIDASNYPVTVNAWVDATNKYTANHSPIVLLIHPNRQWKVDAEISYINQLPDGAKVFPFEKYGDFWRMRDSLKFTTAINNNVMTVTLQTNAFDDALSFVVPYNGLDSIKFENQNGTPIYLDWKPWDYGTRLYYTEGSHVGVNKNALQTQTISVYPNPTQGQLTLYIDQVNKPLNMTIFNVMGRMVYKAPIHQQVTHLNLSQSNLANGIYYMTIYNNQSRITKKIILSR